MFPRTYATIDLTALQHNYARVKHYAPHARILAMLKANAYGHGLVAIAKALPQADAFGVACLEEAINLRLAGVRNPIILMSGCMAADELADIAHHQLTMVIHHAEQLHMLQHYFGQQPLLIWLKIDTGMHRLGFAPTEFIPVLEVLQALPNRAWPLTIMTHFATADEPQSAYTAAQIDCFQRLFKEQLFPVSMANSAAVVAWPQAHGDWVRPGIMLYGGSPITGVPAKDYGLEPVMTLRSKLIATKSLAAGEFVGYGATWETQQTTTIGIVAIGYGDGYPRHAVSGTPVLIRETYCPLIGCVSMDLLAIDLQTCPQAQVGDEVILWGRGLPVETIANAADTISYELLCQVTGRVTLNYR